MAPVAPLLPVAPNEIEPVGPVGPVGPVPPVGPRIIMGLGGRLGGYGRSLLYPPMWYESTLHGVHIFTFTAFKNVLFIYTCVLMFRKTSASLNTISVMHEQHGGLLVFYYLHSTKTKLVLFF